MQYIHSMLFYHVDKRYKTMWNVVKLNRNGQKEEGLLKTSTGITLSATLKRQPLKDATFHTPSHTWNTQQLMHYSCVQWVNERDAALSIQEPFPAVLLWVKVGGKKPLMLILYKTTIWRWFLFQWAQWQSHLTGVTLLMHTGPSEEPQLHSTCGMCPSFHSSTCMYAYECGCVTSIRQRGAFIMCSVEELWRGSVESGSVRAEVSKSEECC